MTKSIFYNVWYVQCMVWYASKTWFGIHIYWVEQKKLSEFCSTLRLTHHIHLNLCAFVKVGRYKTAAKPWSEQPTTHMNSISSLFGFISTWIFCLLYSLCLFFGNYNKTNFVCLSFLFFFMMTLRVVYKNPYYLLFEWRSRISEVFLIPIQNII